MGRKSAFDDMGVWAIQNVGKVWMNQDEEEYQEQLNQLHSEMETLEAEDERNYMECGKWIRTLGRFKEIAISIYKMKLINMRKMSDTV